MHIIRLVTLSLALVSGAASASAHAYLDHASPLVGSTVTSAPNEVRMWFTQALEPRFASSSRHNKSLHYENFGCSRCVALTIRTLAKLMVFLNQFTDGGL